MNARRLMKKRGRRATRAISKAIRGCELDYAYTALELHRHSVYGYLATLKRPFRCVREAKLAGVNLSDAPYGPSAYGRPDSEAWVMLMYASCNITRGFPRGKICRA